MMGCRGAGKHRRMRHYKVYGKRRERLRLRRMEDKQQRKHADQKKSKGCVPVHVPPRYLPVRA